VRYPGDLILLYVDSKPTIYARVESVENDIKAGWFRITMLLLSFPWQVVTWILKEEYIDGTPFTMEGVPIQLTSLPQPGKIPKNQDNTKTESDKEHNPPGGEIISIEEIRKKKEHELKER